MNQGCHEHETQRVDCGDCACDARIRALDTIAGSAGLEGERRRKLFHIHDRSGLEGVRAFLEAASLPIDAAGLAALERAQAWQARVAAEPTAAQSSQHVRRIANSHGLSEREIAMCAELKLDPQIYAADRAARKGL